VAATGASKDTLRCFFAVDLGPEARVAAGALARALAASPGGGGPLDRAAQGGAVRWVRAEALHVTLRFLGDTKPAAIPRLVRDVGAQVEAVPGFTLALGGVQIFPSLRRPRVVALHVVPELPLGGLARAVEAGCVAAGAAPERRAFRAHLTLGRVRDGRSAPSLDGVEAPAPSPFPVREVVLYESRLGPAGSTYHALERVPLGAPVHP
jgi:2'-5' RNA ligase